MMTADQIAARRALVTELDALKKAELCRRAVDIGLYPTITKARAVAADMLRTEILAAHIAAEEVTPPTMMPGQEPYTTEEQERLYALVDAAARANVTELEEVEGQVPSPNLLVALGEHADLSGCTVTSLGVSEPPVLFAESALFLPNQTRALPALVAAEERRARKAAFRARQAGWV